MSMRVRDGAIGSAPPPWSGVLRASGKRFRRKFNPNDWKSSILTMRHNVLCLGMSYPCVEKVIANSSRAAPLFHSAPSVERSVELVRRNLLNQIDGRDLARIVALEANNDILAYTVSKEEGSWYGARHLRADFNSRTLVPQMHARWGEGVRFRQVVLDYFWSPGGSWAIQHWQRSFFNENIPRLVTSGMFHFGDLENDSLFVSDQKGLLQHDDYISSTAAVVYLPFSSHCLSQVVACYGTLSKFYTISFLRKDQLSEHTLWKATNTISPDSMVGWLAKTINQEDIYCTLDARKIRHGTGDASVTKEDILDVFTRINRAGEIRMIKLIALRKFHPDYPKSDMQWAAPTLGLNKGGYVGLMSRKVAAVHNKKVEVNAAPVIANMSRKEPVSVQQTEQRQTLCKRSISCHQLDKLDYTAGQPLRKIPRKRSLSYQQLDDLAVINRRTRQTSKLQQTLQKRSLVSQKLDRIDANVAQPSSKLPRKIEFLAVGRKRERCRSKNNWLNLSCASGKTGNASTKTNNTPKDIAFNREKNLVSMKPNCSEQLRNVFPDLGLHVGHRATMKNQYNSGSSSWSVSSLNRETTTKPKETDVIDYPAETSNTAVLTIPEKQNLPGSTQVCPVSESRNPTQDPNHAPIAMTKIAKLRCAKTKAFIETLPSVEDGDKASEATEQTGKLPQKGSETTPKANDVLLGVEYHAHPGNVQFFNVFRMCKHHFPIVTDCFVGALKSLTPPGRFLGKQDGASGMAWACVEYGEAIGLVPHLLDHYDVAHCDSSRNVVVPNNMERSSDFFFTVRRLFDAKPAGTRGNAGSVRLFEDDPMCLLEDTSLVEGTVTTPCFYASLEDDDVCIDGSKIVPTASCAADPESTASCTRIASNVNSLDLSNPVVSVVSADSRTAEEACFWCLVEWLRPTPGITDFDAPLRTALTRFSEQCNTSVYKLLSLAFEDEAASLHSLCKDK